MKRQNKTPKPEDDATFSRNVLDQLINERLVAQEIEKRGFSVNDAMVDRAIDGVMQQNAFRSIDELKKALRDEGMSLEEYRVSVKKQMETSRLINAAIRPKVQVADQDIDASLRRSGEGAPTEWKTDVRMILKKKPKATKKSMERLRRQIDAGIPFERVAARETEGPAKTEGGHIGLVSPTDLQPELGKVLSQMKPGQISNVVETKQGFYLIQLIGREQAPTKSAILNRDSVREDLEKKELDRNFELFVRGLREKANVEVKL
jgi:peptidyl-prolyl cis-trans isomerase SurA